MTKQEQIEEMANIPYKCIKSSCEGCIKNDRKCSYYTRAEALYNAGYRKTFTSDLASDKQKAFKEGYEKAQSELKTEIERLKAENDKIDKESTAYALIIQKQEKEIEDLTLQNIELQKRNEKLFFDYCKERKRLEKQCVRRVKQAVKEFAKRLKTDPRTNALGLEFVAIVDIDAELNALLKEYEK